MYILAFGAFINSACRFFISCNLTISAAIIIFFALPHEQTYADPLKAEAVARVIAATVSFILVVQ